MVPRPLSTRSRRVAVLAVLALVLLTAPFWIGHFDLSEDVVTYERSQVVAEDGEVTYAEPPEDPRARVPISDRIGCTRHHIPRDDRLCAYEGALATGNLTAVTGYVQDRTGSSHDDGSPYTYVAVNDGVYELTIEIGNETEEVPEIGSEMYPMYLGLDRVRAATALDRASTPVDHAAVPDSVRTAARSGNATTRGDVHVPQRPIELETGQYYRVYRSDVSDPPRTDVVLSWLGRYLAPLLGLVAALLCARELTRSRTEGRPR